MNITPLKTKKDYKLAMSRLDKIFDAKLGTPERDELEVLGIEIEKYESIHFPIDHPNPTKNRLRLQESVNQMNKKQTRKVNLKNI